MATTFVAECYWPGLSEDQGRAAMAQVVAAEQEVPSDVRCVGCIVMPSDGVALFLFHAPSAADVELTSDRSGIRFERIIESVQLVVDAV